MRTIILVAIISISICCSPSYDFENSLTIQDLNGKVETLKELVYEVQSNGELAPIDKLSIQTVNSNHGLNINVDNYKKYDASGFETESGAIESDGSLTIKNNSTYIFEGDKVIQKVNRLKTDDIRIEYLYDQKGKLKDKKMILSKNDFVGSHSSYIYDKNGFQIEQTIHAKGEIKVQFTNNDHGKMKKSIATIKGKIMDITEYVYDEFQNCIGETQIDKDGNILKMKKWKFEYDGQKNWVKKTHLIDGQPKYVIERKIQYY